MNRIEISIDKPLRCIGCGEVFENKAYRSLQSKEDTIIRYCSETCKSNLPTGYLTRLKDHYNKNYNGLPISLDDWLIHTKQDCTLCGKPGPNQINRFSPNKPYTNDNVYSCCGGCKNMVGSYLSLELWLSKAISIINHLR